MVEQVPRGLRFGVNLAGLLSILAWTVGWSVIIFGILKAAKLLRVSVNLEMNGMDIEKHGEPAYPISAWKEGWRDFFTQSSGPGTETSSKLVLALMELGFNMESDPSPIQQNEGQDNSAFQANNAYQPSEDSDDQSCDLEDRL